MILIMLIVCIKIEPTLFRLRLEKAEAEQELKKVLGQLLYLDNLNKVCTYRFSGVLYTLNLQSALGIRYKG